MLVSLITAMPLGAFKLLPFWLHGKLELVSGLLFIASPWLFGFAHENPAARNIFVAAGGVFLVVYALTDWYPQGRRAQA